VCPGLAGTEDVRDPSCGFGREEGRDSVFCPSCGRAVSTDDRFCQACGTKLERGDASSAFGTKRRPYRLKSSQYEHRDDRLALSSLRAFSPVVAVSRLLIRRFNDPMFRAQLLGGSVRVGPHQFSRLDAIVAECSAVLNLPPPEVYVVNNPRFNAMTFGVDRTFIILHSSLVDAFTPAELSYIVGHELGHIKSEHVLYLNAAWFLAQGAAAYLGRVVLLPARMALEAWMRKAEFTADRAGLICCQDPQVAAMSLIKLALGSLSLVSQVNVEEYLRQTEELRGGYGPLAEFFQTHPFIANRIQELRAFHREGYEAIFHHELTPAGRDEGQVDPGHRAVEALARGLEIMGEAGRSPVITARGKWRRALEEFVFVRNQFPDTDAAVQAQFYIATVNMHLGHAHEATKGFQAFLEAHTDHQLAPEAQYSLAYCYDKLLHNREAATRAYADYVRKYPGWGARADVETP